MADFRKLFLALIAGALLLTTVASAQVTPPYSCQATAVPPLVRSEGIAEMMGDILLVCSGTPAAPITANVRLKLSTNINITSNPLGSVSEATLVLDEGDGGFKGSGAAGQNVYQAIYISNDEIEWEGVVLYPGPPTNPASTIRLTNVRGNVQSRGDFATIWAYINIVSPTSVPVTNNQLVVADTRPGLEFSTSQVSFRNCEEPGSQLSLEFKEGFSAAFKPKGVAQTENTVPGGGYLNESGFNPTPVTGDLTSRSSIGQATQGTRLMARFKNVPSGVTLSVPPSVTTASGMTVQLVSGPYSDGSGGSLATGPGDVPPSGLVVYEVVGLGPTSYFVTDTVSIPVTVSYGIPGALGSASVNGNFAPISTTHYYSSSAPEPRFVDTATDTGSFTISPCRTILLFPYVTQYWSATDPNNRWDTGIAIANTSKDPLGTTNQAGTCSLYFYGNSDGSAGPPSPQTTPSVPAGGYFAMTLSGGGGVVGYNGAGSAACAAGNCVASKFTGYLIAMCNFQYAHGYAFISDYGSQKFAQGYLALIIPDRGQYAREPVSSSLGADANHGEQLGN